MLLAVEKFEVADDSRVHWLYVRSGVRGKESKGHVAEGEAWSVAGGIVQQQQHSSIISLHLYIEAC